MPNYRQTTLLKHDLFFASLAKHGVVTRALQDADLDHRTTYTARRDDPEFAERWQRALEAFADSLETAAYQRAVAGYPKGVWHQGVMVGEEIQYSDSLLRAMLKAKRKREYGDASKIELTGADGGALKVEQSPTEIARSIAFALALGLRAKEQQAAAEPADGSDLA